MSREITNHNVSDLNLLRVIWICCERFEFDVSIWFWCDSCGPPYWSLKMLQVGCRGCLVDVWVLYFTNNNFLPSAFNLSTKSHGIYVRWRSMLKSLWEANRKSLRFCPAISTLFGQGFPLEFANLKYFSFVGQLSRQWVKFRRHQAHNDSSPSIFLYLER